jgi:sec-independent protein translocase protein TatA
MLISVLLFLGGEDVILIALVVLLLFGGQKIPALMKSMGKGVKSFKDAIEGLDSEMKDPKKDASSKEAEKDKPSDKPVS